MMKDEWRMMNSRADPVRWLLADAVPEIGSGIVEVKAIARERGKTKIAVYSRDQNIDPVHACLGFLKDQSQKGHSIQMIRWDDAIETLIARALQPAEVEEVVLDRSARRATAVVPVDQMPLAMGPGERNRRLASQLCGYEIELVTPDAPAEEPER